MVATLVSSEVGPLCFAEWMLVGVTTQVGGESRCVGTCRPALPGPARGLEQRHWALGSGVPACGVEVALASRLWCATLPREVHTDLQSAQQWQTPMACPRVA